MPGKRGYQVNAFAMSLEEIAIVEGITKERVRQIQESALEKLRRHGITSTLLRQFYCDKSARQYASPSRTTPRWSKEY